MSALLDYFRNQLVLGEAVNPAGDIQLTISVTDLRLLVAVLERNEASS